MGTGAGWQRWPIMGGASAAFVEAQLNAEHHSMVRPCGRCGRWFGTNTDFRINTESFPPVFAGTLTSNTNIGRYDPVYPPKDINLAWWYGPDWGTRITDEYWIHHVGEYNGAWLEEDYVCMTWSDSRMISVHTNYGRKQPDI